ncbi:MAG: hypothetical protein ACC645_19995 [Pirellulales bacterium]
MRTCRTTIGQMALMLALIAATDAAWAQGRSYQPSRPKFSPYLDLLRSDPGQILPSYQAYVVPRIEVRRFKQQQESNIRRIDTRLQQARRQEAVPTGIASEFRNNDRFFRTSPTYFRTHRPRQ